MSTKGYKILGSALILALVVSLVLLVERQLQLAHIRADIRLGRDIAFSFRGKRDWALKRGPTEVAGVLYSLQVAPFPEPSDNPVAGFVERERLRCIADLISFLRARTGQDLGDKPDPWIRTFGDETIRHCQTNFADSR
jgi:hypothetical protein